MAIAYIGKTSSYWLQVILDKGPEIAVPYGLKIDRTGQKNGREYFKILEGVYQGKTASVVASAASTYLSTSVRHKPGVKLTFDLKKQSLTFGSHPAVNAFSGGGHAGYTPVAVGSYLLAIPAYPSAQTRPAYSKWCKHHNLWFRIGIETTGSRFLHPGAISDGCVTVRQFLYDPAAGKPPAGFEDLEQGSKTSPGLIGLPLPTDRAPCISWDIIVDELILARHNDQAIGTLTVV